MQLNTGEASLQDNAQCLLGRGSDGSSVGLYCGLSPWHRATGWPRAVVGGEDSFKGKWARKTDVGPWERGFRGFFSSLK